MSKARASAAEWFIMTAVGENPRSLVPGSIRLDGYALDWTQRIGRTLYARTCYLNRQTLLDVVIRAAETGD